MKCSAPWTVTVAAVIWYRLTLGGITGHRDFARDTGVIVKPADAVVDGVAEDGGREKQQDHQPDIQHAGRRQRARGKEQRIAREEGRDDEPRFREDDGEEQPVNDSSVIGGKRREVDVQIQKQIEQFCHVCSL